MRLTKNRTSCDLNTSIISKLHNLASGCLTESSGLLPIHPTVWNCGEWSHGREGRGRRRTDRRWRRRQHHLKWKLFVMEGAAARTAVIGKSGRTTNGRTDGNFSSFCAMRDDSYGRREGRKGLWLPEFWRQIDRWSEYPREGRTKSFETLQLWYRSISFNLTFGRRVRGTSSLLGQPSLSDCLPHTDAVPSLILSSHLPVHRCFRGISHSVSPRQRRWASDAQGGHVLLGALKTCHLFIPIISGTVSASGWTKVLERCETAQ